MEFNQRNISEFDQHKITELNQGAVPEPDRNIITFKNVTKIFNSKSKKPVCALNKVSFDIKEHEIISFVGPSGCGKTTVLRIISGLEIETKGEVTVRGKAAKTGMCGMIFQNYSSFPWLTVLENVAFGLKLEGANSNQREEVAHEYIDLVGLNGYENHYPKELSGGQKQRVAIARTLAVKQNILLMDEPFGALDIKTRVEMQELLLRIWQKVNPTIIIVTHDIQEAVYLPNRTFIFSEPSQTNEDSEIKQLQKPISINKKIEDRTLEWKKSYEFELYEKALKEIQFK